MRGKARLNTKCRTPTTTDQPGVFKDSAGGHTGHVDTSPSHYTDGLFYLDYRLYPLGQGPSIDELDASGSCWLCSHPPL